MPAKSDLCKPVHHRFSKMIHLKLRKKSSLFGLSLHISAVEKLRHKELILVDLNLMIVLDLTQAAVNSYF